MRPFSACLLILALTAFFSVSALRQGRAAASLAARDYEFLQKEFGFARDGFVLKNISGENMDRLARIMHDPNLTGSSETLRLNLLTLLFYIERNTCYEWEQTNHSSPCPEVGDPRFRSGWAVAEHSCIPCHLTGTTVAKSFFKMAREKSVDEHLLATALGSEIHPVSRIGLSQQDLRELVAYINSLH